MQPLAEICKCRGSKSLKVSLCNYSRKTRVLFSSNTGKGHKTKSHYRKEIFHGFLCYEYLPCKGISLRYNFSIYIPSITIEFPLKEIFKGLEK